VIFDVHRTHRPFRRFAALLLSMLAVTAPALATTLADNGSWQSVLVAHAGWTALAGLGLLAVAVAARHVSRPRTEQGVDGIPPQGIAPPARLAPVAIEPEKTVAVPAASPPNVIEARPIAAPAGSQLFLALHHVDLSIDVLRRHLEREPRPMPAVWLMLLDLARTHGREQTFCELALEFHQRFNACTPTWASFPPGRDEAGLEAYPRLVKEITLSWGTHECGRLIDRLLFDNRGGQRRGFTLNAYNDLIALKRASDTVLDTIDQDLAEEAKVRSAFAMAAADIAAPEPREADATGDAAEGSPLVRELECELETDLREELEPQSAIEREHPALVAMLTREWSNAALVGRICEILARGGHGLEAVSGEAAEEIELLRRLAEGPPVASGHDPNGTDEELGRA
jgi:hypothetical protein